MSQGPLKLRQKNIQDEKPSSVSDDHSEVATFSSSWDYAWRKYHTTKARLHCLARVGTSGLFELKGLRILAKENFKTTGAVTLGRPVFMSSISRPGVRKW